MSRLLQLTRTLLLLLLLLLSVKVFNICNCNLPNLAWALIDIFGDNVGAIYDLGKVAVIYGLGAFISEMWRLFMEYE